MDKKKLRKEIEDFFADYENCKIPVTSIFLNEDDEPEMKGLAGFSKSRKACVVWYDDSHCNKYVLKKNGKWKISGVFEDTDEFDIVEER